MKKQIKRKLIESDKWKTRNVNIYYFSDLHQHKKNFRNWRSEIKLIAKNYSLNTIFISFFSMWVINSCDCRNMRKKYFVIGNHKFHISFIFLSFQTTSDSLDERITKLLLLSLMHSFFYFLWFLNMRYRTSERELKFRTFCNPKEKAINLKVAFVTSQK